MLWLILDVQTEKFYVDEQQCNFRPSQRIELTVAQLDFVLTSGSEHTLVPMLTRSAEFGYLNGNQTVLPEFDPAAESLRERRSEINQILIQTVAAAITLRSSKTESNHTTEETETKIYA